MQSPDILIIGGGVAGLAGALALARRGMSVVALNSPPPNGAEHSASWGGGGILAPLPPWGAAPEVQNLAQRGAKMFPDWLASLSPSAAAECGHRRCGMLVVSPFRAAEQFAEWKKNARCEFVNPKKIAPHIRFAESGAENGVWLPDVCQVRPPRVLKALEKKLRETPNVMLAEDWIARMKSAGGRVVAAVSAAGREYSAGHFVIAAGAWSARFAPPPRPDIRPLRGHMALYRAPEKTADAGSVILFGDGLYLIPRRDGLLLAGGGVEDAGYNSRPDSECVGRLRRRAEGAVPGLSAPERIWTGLRPATPGNIPVVERHPARENLYFHSGHFRYGLTTAPATAERLAEIVCEGG